MKAYSAHVANLLPDEAWKSQEAQDEVIEDAKERYDAMFEDVAEGEQHVEHRYWLVKILSSCKANPLVDADGKLKSVETCKTFANDMLELFDVLNFPQRHLALNLLESIDEPVSAADLSSLISAAEKMDKTEMRQLFPNANGGLYPAKGELPTAQNFCGGIARLYNQAKDKINEARQQAEATVTDPKPEEAGDQPEKPADEETKYISRPSSARFPPEPS